MVNIRNIISHIPSKNMRSTSEFFVSLFDFKIDVNTVQFIELKNKNYSIGLLKTETIKNEQSIYFEVSNIDELWRKIKDKITLHKHKELFKQEYGMKEFHVVIPETSTLLMVGERTHLTN